jgi:pimeloyl-ACP methyl ester carboxylesterase
MEKASPTNVITNASGLFSRFSRKKDNLLDSFAPGWTDNKIERLLFVHGNKNSKSREPKGIRQFEIKANDGKIKAYETGKGPAVVFVHGWGGCASQFFPLMRGLAQRGFRALSFDQLGHGQSEQKPASLHQTIATTNRVLDQARQSQDGLCAIVGHSTGCIDIAAARNALVRDLALFLISPVFDYRRFFLKKLVGLNLHSDVVRRYANGFARVYSKEYQKLGLARNLAKYADHTVIAHSESDTESSIKDAINFCTKHPLTRLLTLKDSDHVLIINSESVWQELKTHLDCEDTPSNFTAEVTFQDSP